MGNLGIAFVVLTPMALAWDWAWFHWASRFLRISVRRSVLAFCTTMLSGRDLDPLAVLHDWYGRYRFSVKAACAALPILSPLADCGNWAWHWLRITKLNLHLILLTAFLSTMLSFFGDFKVTSLGAIGLPSMHSMSRALRGALLPLCPIALARYWARMLVAGNMLQVSSLVQAFISTMLSFLCDHEDSLCPTTSAVTAAL